MGITRIENATYLILLTSLKRLAYLSLLAVVWLPTLSYASPPAISGPTSSTTGDYTISWSPGAGDEYAKLQEWTSVTGWKTPQKLSGTSKHYVDKPDGTYKYKVKTCFREKEENVGGWTEHCSSYSAEHVVEVARPSDISAGGRIIHTTLSMFANNLPDNDQDGLADEWENEIALRTRPDVRLDEEENFLNHSNHDVIDFVRVVPLVTTKSRTISIPSKTTPSKSRRRYDPRRQYRPKTIRYGGPMLSGPDTSTGTYTLRWRRNYTGRNDYGRLREQTRCGNKTPIKVSGQSRTFHNKPDGIYSYRLQECFREPDAAGGPELCTAYGPTHTVSVANPNHLGYLLVAHVLTWSRDYGRLCEDFSICHAHNGDTEQVLMLWKIINDKQIELQYVFTSAHDGTESHHSGVWKVCAGCTSCNTGKFKRYAPEGISIGNERHCATLQFANNRLRVRASEDKHAVYPTKKMCEDVKLGVLEPGPAIGEDCGDGPLLDSHSELPVYNVGEKWASLIDRLNDHAQLQHVFPNEAIWSGGDFCGGLGNDNCPGPFRTKLEPPRSLLTPVNLCNVVPGRLTPTGAVPPPTETEPVPDPPQRDCTGPYQKCCARNPDGRCLDCVPASRSCQ